MLYGPTQKLMLQNHFNKKCFCSHTVAIIRNVFSMLALTNYLWSKYINLVYLNCLVYHISIRGLKQSPAYKRQLNFWTCADRSTDTKQIPLSKTMFLPFYWVALSENHYYCKLDAEDLIKSDGSVLTLIFKFK